VKTSNQSRELRPWRLSAFLAKNQDFSLLGDFEKLFISISVPKLKKENMMMLKSPLEQHINFYQSSFIFCCQFITGYRWWNNAMWNERSIVFFMVNTYFLIENSNIIYMKVCYDKQNRILSFDSQFQTSID